MSEDRGINLRALFSDESSMFRIPEEPNQGETMTIRFRTLKGDVDGVTLSLLFYGPQEENSAVCVKEVEIPMKTSSARKKEKSMEAEEKPAVEAKTLTEKKIVAEAKNLTEEKPAVEAKNLTEKKIAAEENLTAEETEVQEAASAEETAEFDTQFDFYEAEISVGDEPFWYYFKVNKGSEQICYNKLGVTEEKERRYNFVVRPGVHVPEWAKGAVFYQIFVDRFCNGDPSNDVLNREYLYVDGIPSTSARSWSEDSLALDVGRFYGGDLQGVLDKLDYIGSLGVNAIYFNPIFVSPSNHKYDSQDYDYIDPHYGVILDDEGDLLPEGAHDNQSATRYISRVTSFKNLEASNELFAKLCKEAHKRGIRIVLDGVFNHCGSFNKWLDRERIYEKQEGYEKGAFVSKESPYRGFFHFRSDNWPYNPSYEGWWDHDTLPKLNYEESEELCNYVMHVARKWVSEPFCVDGWRLDVAADLGHSEEFNHKFWKRFRENVKESNEEALILAEHYGDASKWLQGDEWDTIMNYDAFMEPVTWFLTGLEKHSDRYDAHMFNNGQVFYDTMRYNMARMHRGALLTAMNELSNHDHSRFMTRTNRRVGRLAYLGARAAEEGINKGIFREGVVIQMTWPGAPTIYYGDETGLCGWTDPDSRRTYPWDDQDLELIEFQKYMGGIHKRNKALQTGSMKFLGYDYGILMYGRFEKDNRIAIAVNNQEEDVELDIPVWELGIKDNTCMRRLMSTSEKGYNVGAKLYTVENGMVHVEVTAYGSVILQNEEQ
ncbi:MAG: alpha amylase N-terminal ig-like domain-containing protein [Lachnospiraceae bacterium]|nr:alpha amylase N-terminal ig-like domain-containing protein [Lachnospiraceae bacterium]